MNENLIDSRNAAIVLGVSRAFLERDRWAGPTIPFVRVGRGKGVVRYRMVDLENYINSRLEGAKREVAE